MTTPSQVVRSVYLDRKIYDIFKKLAKREDRSTNYMINELIKKYVSENKDKIS